MVGRKPSYSSVSQDRKSTRLNSSHVKISYAVFCLKKKNNFLRRRVAQEGQPHRRAAGFWQVGPGGQAVGGAGHRSAVAGRHRLVHFFFFNDTATTEIYTLSLHDALPI